MSLLTDDESQANDYNYQEQKPTDTINGVVHHARELGSEYLQRLESNRIFPTSQKETGCDLTLMMRGRIRVCVQSEEEFSCQSNLGLLPNFNCISDQITIKAISKINT